MTWTANEEKYLVLFEEALRFRDKGELDEALHWLDVVVTHLTAEDGRLLAHTHIQAGGIHDRRENPWEAERHLRLATVAAPRLGLASLGLFHALLDLGRRRDALAEMVRFLALGRICADYKMLLEGEDFRNNLSLEELELANVARELVTRLVDVKPTSWGDPDRGDPDRG